MAWSICWIVAKVLDNVEEPKTEDVIRLFTNAVVAKVLSLLVIAGVVVDVPFVTNRLAILEFSAVNVFAMIC